MLCPFLLKNAPVGLSNPSIYLVNFPLQIVPYNHPTKRVSSYNDFTLTLNELNIIFI